VCGHCGVIGPGINSWDLSIVRDLLTVSALRGEDSTGVLQGLAQNWFGHDKIDYVIEKMASESLYFKWYHLKSSKGNKRLLNSVSDNFICCHVRAATKGSIVDENAHPFEFEKFIGMHNGTLREKKYEDSKTNKTDSELMFKDMDERGIIPVLESLDPFSAYAIVLFNKENGEISFVRNSQRTLYYAIHATRSVLYYASEIWMLREMAARNTEKLYKDTVYEFKPDIIYTFHPQDFKAKDIMPFVQTPYKAKKFETTYNQNKNHRIQQQQELLALPSPREIIRPVNQNRLDFSKITLNSKTKIPVVHCCGCQRKLSPLEVFYATKLNTSGSTVICNECDSEFTRDFHQGQSEVIIN
jgi:asparagine synthetase B (glutamine-hydrolysing)